MSELENASAILDAAVSAGKLNPSQTVITLTNAIRFLAWPGFPAQSAEIATLYGGLDQAGPYLVIMKWYPGYFSAPHFYATDRLSLVLSGTWWVASEPCRPGNAVPVPTGSFVRRVAHTPHYDGAIKTASEPAVIALFGLAPVQGALVNSSKPGWYQV